jgi:cytochrome c oxidase cbb3-type subunit 2
MAENDQVRDPDKDPNVSTAKDFPEEIPNELPHHSWIFRHHHLVEKNVFLLLVLSFIEVNDAGHVQIVPLFYHYNTNEKVEGMRPFSPLELAGRDIYVREGCFVCLRQMIRVMRDEVERYGLYSLAA